MNVYKVNEIFYSLQGEGFHTGTPAVFVRLSGCNLRCDFCDTDHSRGIPMSAVEIAEEAGRYPATTVIITGGEPTLYNLGPLVDALHATGRRVHLETNGTNPVTAQIDWITCSPKHVKAEDGTASFLYTPEISRQADELKVVFTSDEGLEELAVSFATANLFLQPCSGKNTDLVVDYILAHPRWRLSLQTHKLLDIR